MTDGFEIELGECRQRLCAAIARRAVEDVGLVPVERGKSFLEIGGAEIDVGCSRDVSGGKFFRRADVEHDNLLFCDQLLRLFSVDVCNIGFTGVCTGDATCGDDELCEAFQAGIGSIHGWVMSWLGLVRQEILVSGLSLFTSVTPPESPTQPGRA